MKEKNGFVFVETMIVVVVLISILLVIYSSYTGLVSIERKRARYDDPSFIYKTYAVGQFLLSIKDSENNLIIKNKIEDSDEIIHIAMNDIDLFTVDEEGIVGTIHRKNFFNTLYNNLNIQDILILNKNQIENMKEKEVSSDLYNYLKSLNISGESDSQYYLVVMYAEKINGTSCNPNELISNDPSNVNKESSCTFYYSSLKLDKEV